MTDSLNIYLNVVRGAYASLVKLWLGGDTSLFFW